MSSSECTGSCGGCNGCSEKVTLSTNEEISWVSSLTFSERNLDEARKLILVTECKKFDDNGVCYVGIKFYKDGEMLESSVHNKYTVTVTELSQQNFEFDIDKNADKAEIMIYCVDGATLNIEHINVMRR